MPGIYGVSMQLQDLEPSLNAMRDAMLLYPHFHNDELFIDQVCGASRVHLSKIGQKNSPHTGDDGSRVWIEGEVYNLPEILRGFGWSGANTDNDSFPSWLLHAYQVGKLDALLNRLDGYFCAAIYDPSRKKISLVSDRYGMRMLYWYHHNGLFAWASEVKGLLGIERVDRTIDATTLPCFMDLGYLMGEHTWFEHIHLIKPATILEYDIDVNKLSQRYYWTWAEIKPSHLSFDEAVDALYETFMESVRRRFNPNERIGISLSGGLDSRAIFAAVNQLYPDYEGYAYTFGIPGCDDIRIAKQVVTRSNWQHDEYHFSSKDWFHPRKEMIWNTDGMFDMMHMHGGEFLERISNKIDVNLNGYLGDVVAGGSWIHEKYMNQRSSANNVSDFYKKFSSYQDFTDPYFNIAKREPALYSSRARRFTNMGTVNGLVSVEQRKPFFDNKVIEILLSLEDDFRLSNRLYSTMLQRYFSRFFRDIPWQKTGMPAGVFNSSKISSVKVINKLNWMVKFLAGIEDLKDYANYAKWIREPEIASELKRILTPSNSHYNRLTQQDWYQSYLLPHLSSTIVNNSNKILRASTIELYMREAYNRNNASC